MVVSGILYKDRLDHHHPDVKIITDWLHCALQSILVMIRLAALCIPINLGDY